MISLALCKENSGSKHIPYSQNSAGTENSRENPEERISLLFRWIIGFFFIYYYTLLAAFKYPQIISLLGGGRIDRE